MKASNLIPMAVAMALALVGAAPAQTDQPAPDSLRETYGAWTMSCSAGYESCNISQTFYTQESNRRVARITVFRPEGKGSAMVVRALTPLGSRLRKGTLIRIDEGANVALPYLACLSHGCLSEVALTPALELALRVGDKITLSFVHDKSGKTVQMELALDGFGFALDRMSGF